MPILTKNDYRLMHRIQLVDPRWKRRSKEIRERDIVCQKCGSSEHLQVHHKFYIPGKALWEYSDELLILLCDDCHKNEHVNLKIIEQIIKDCKEFLFADELLDKIKFLKLPKHR